MNPRLHDARRRTFGHSVWTAVLAAAIPNFALAQPGTTTRVSISSSGEQAKWPGQVPASDYRLSISANGRYIAFDGKSANLVTGTMLTDQHVYLHDRASGETIRVSETSSGEEANKKSGEHGISISADGRYVAFDSLATNLVEGDTNDRRDVFVYDHQTKRITRVSVSELPAAAGPASGDAAHARRESRTTIQGNNGSGNIGLCISADGRFVAFDSYASNLIPGGTHNVGVFVHDRQSGITSLVSISSSGKEGNSTSGEGGLSISGDGSYVAFCSDASDLVAGDSNGTKDIFVHNRQTGKTTRVSVSSSGHEADKGSINPCISSDGRFVAFYSGATNLVDGDKNHFGDVFVHDLQTSTTIRASIPSDAKEANNESGLLGISISGDGRFVSFVSGASNLVPGDTNDHPDVFVRDLKVGKTSRVSVSSAGQQGNNSSVSTSISSNGRFVAFYSDATDLVTQDTNGYEDVFVHELLVSVTPPLILPPATTRRATH